MSTRTEDSARFYSFGFRYKGIPGRVSVAPGGACIELTDGRSWHNDEVPNAVALAVLKSRIAAAREVAKSAYPYGLASSLEVSRETLDPEPRKFVQVADGFDAANLAILDDRCPTGTCMIDTGNYRCIHCGSVYVAPYARTGS